LDDTSSKISGGALGLCSLGFTVRLWPGLQVIAAVALLLAKSKGVTQSQTPYRAVVATKLHGTAIARFFGSGIIPQVA
jgi:hypothetical protein